jgi:hypothetical protein
MIYLGHFLQLPLHTLKTRNMIGSDLTSIAWNHASERYMLATASHDGCVRVWMSSPSENEPTRDKAQEQEVTPSDTFHGGLRKGISASLQTLRKQTTETEGGFTLVDSPEMDGRPSLEGSVETSETGTAHETPTRRRADSLPHLLGDSYRDKGKDPDIYPTE